MGKKERIKRQKRLRIEKQLIQKRLHQNIINDEIVDEAMHKLKNKLSTDFISKPTQGPVKYSEILTDFVSPLLAISEKDPDSMNLIYKLGILVWNLVVTKKSRGQSDSVLLAEQKLKVIDGERFRFLLARKEDQFSQYNVIYVNFELVNRKGDIGISTAVVDMNHPPQKTLD